MVGSPSSRNSHCQPARAVRAAELGHQPARQRPADHARHGDARHEQRGDLGAPRGREPVGQVEHDGREEAGLGHAEQEAHHVELQRRVHEHHARRQEAPGHHDPRDPAARADPQQQQVARHLEQQVADEEHARAEAVDGLVETEIAEHLQLGEGDVDAVEIGGEVAEKQERHEPQRGFRERRGLAAFEEGGLAGGIHACLLRGLAVAAAARPLRVCLRRPVLGRSGARPPRQSGRLARVSRTCRAGWRADRSRWSGNAASRCSRCRRARGCSARAPA